MRTGILTFLAFFLATEVMAAEQLWVTSDRLNRRTCPSTNCGVVGQLFFREGVTVLEERDGWVRISKSYDASCRGGKSDYVESGNAECSPSNGIAGGQFSEWVFAKYLSSTRPDDPGAGATGIAKSISQSDDFKRYKSAFVKATTQLINAGRCNLNEFEDNGGWVKSTTTYRNQPVYFMYCGGLTAANRIYLNAETGRIFQ